MSPSDYPFTTYVQPSPFSSGTADVVPVTDADTPPSRRLDRRSFFVTAGTTASTLLAGCLSDPSSGGPAYEAMEIDDGRVFGPGLRDETERDYYAALVVTEEDAELFDLERLSDTGTTFLRETDFEESYLGMIQVSALNSSMRFEIVDLHDSDVNLTVNVAVRDDSPYSDDRVITTLLLRVARAGGGPPDSIAVELDIGDHHQTFSGSRP